MAVNKVMYGNQTLIDLSTDTVASSDDILLGKVGHLRDGSVVTGTGSGGDPHGTIWQDGQGYVHLDDESGIALQSKSVTPSESQQIVEAGEGYYALDTVTVGAISSSYVGSGVSRRSSSDLTVSGATVTAPAGYYSAQASKSVATGTAGTPTATKGTVSNHAVTVTPSVTNTTGYISGSTKTGTGVSVSASELVSGTYSVTSSGTKDVTNYASASVPAGTEGTPTATKGTVSNHSVSVTPSVTNTTGFIGGTTKTGTAVTVSASELVSGTKSITENGTGIDVTNYASVDVNVVSTPVYTATVSSNATSSYVSIEVNGTGTDYADDGSTFTWTDGDNIVFRLGTSDWDSYVYVNGERVKHSYGGYYTYTPPSKDISINMTIASGDKLTVEITYHDDFIITFTQNQSGDWEPNCTYTEAYDAYSAGKTIAGRTNATEGVGFEFDNGNIYYTISEFYDSSDGTGVKQTQYYWNFGSITNQGETITYDTALGNAVPSDVASGKYFFNAQGEQIGTNSGPSGAYGITANGSYNIAQYASVNVNVTSVPSVVTGTFTPNSANAGTAVDISIPYTGSGYPIELTIDVDGGTEGNTNYQTLIDRYSMARQFYSKMYYSITPIYGSSGMEDQFRTQYLYKSSDTSATTYSTGSSSAAFLTNNANATATSSNCIRMKSATTMSIFVKSTSYGYSPNITYRYLILYSS